MAFSRLNQRLNLKIDFEDAKVITPKSDCYTLRIGESSGILNKENSACNDV